MVMHIFNNCWFIVIRLDVVYPPQVLIASALTAELFLAYFTREYDFFEIRPKTWVKLWNFKLYKKLKCMVRLNFQNSFMVLWSEMVAKFLVSRTFLIAFKVQIGIFRIKKFEAESFWNFFKSTIPWKNERGKRWHILARRPFVARQLFHQPNLGIIFL